MSGRAKLQIRLAMAKEHQELEALQRRASLALAEYRAQLEAEPDAIQLPMAQIEQGEVIVADMGGRHEPISWGVYPLRGKDGLYVRWNGGGGLGDPLDRPADQVVNDVTAGAISARAAEEVYGVAFKDGVLDPTLTEVRRRDLKARRLQEVA